MTAAPLTRWTLQALDGPAPQEVAGRVVPVTVPGTVHTDLLFQLIDGSTQPQRWSPVGTLLVRESTGTAPH